MDHNPSVFCSLAETDKRQKLCSLAQALRPMSRQASSAASDKGPRASQSNTSSDALEKATVTFAGKICSSKKTQHGQNELN